jgi:hypothetical protein
MMLESFTRVNEGYYYVRKGDTAKIVAQRVYGGDGHKSSVLLKANPEIWDEESFITVPGVDGRVANILPGESPASVIRRMFPGQPVHLYQDRFFVWNGGKDRTFEGGGLVFVPER